MLALVFSKMCLPSYLFWVANCPVVGCSIYHKMGVSSLCILSPRSDLMGIYGHFPCERGRLIIFNFKDQVVQVAQEQRVGCSMTAWSWTGVNILFNWFAHHQCCPLSKLLQHFPTRIARFYLKDRQNTFTRGTGHLDFVSWHQGVSLTSTVPHVSI